MGSRVQHRLDPIYTPSPFPAINDEGVGPNSTVESWATEASLSYNTVTVELLLDTSGVNGGAIFSYQVQSKNPIVEVQQFVPAHVDGLGSAKTTDDGILEVNWEGITAANRSLGSILPSGLSESEFESQIDFAEFLGEPGHDVASFNLQASGLNMTIKFVPEPRGLKLVFLLMLSLFGSLRNCGMLRHDRE